MITKIRTVHEEEYSDKSKTFGVLLNYDVETNERVDSLTYTYHDGMYMFFNTLVDLIDYQYYGSRKVKRACLDEDKFDVFYDNEINGKFTDELTWS